MEQRLAATWRMTGNEKKFIQTGLLSDLRVDGRSPFDYRRLAIKFGREDGSSQVQLGQTHVVGFVTSQLVQPYRDRPNEGTLSIYTEFSPMADPSFEAGRPTESAVELGRVIDRGLRESRAVDMESLCVIAGKLVWAIRVDLHIIDNGGNLVDAANIAALAALLTFKRPECTLSGKDGQEVIVHPPEVREPLPLIIHHLPIAVSFGFFSNENIVAIDPTHNEEAVMEGRLTATLNTNGDVCAIQKAGGDGVTHSIIMQCLRIASVKAADITSTIKRCVESYNTERALRKIKRHSSSTASTVCDPRKMAETESSDNMCTHHTERSHDSALSQSNNVQSVDRRDGHDMIFTGGTSSWDPYSKGVDANALRVSLVSEGTGSLEEVRQEQNSEMIMEKVADDIEPVDNDGLKFKQKTTLMKAIEPKQKRRKKSASNADS